MSKAQLVKNIADKCDVSQKKAAEIINCFFDNVQGTLAKGQNITLVGFGTFYVTKRAATTGRNPRTGAPIKIKACKQPKFRAGKNFKKIVNK